MKQEIKYTYFTRFFVPVLISIFILCLVGSIIATPSGTNFKWDTFATVFPPGAKIGGRR